MTVEELIKILEKHPKDNKIYIYIPRKLESVVQAAAVYVERNEYYFPKITLICAEEE